MKIIEILKYVEENENSAFFYTPNIYPNGKSYFFKEPSRVLQGKTEIEIMNILDEVDHLIRKEDLIGFAVIPYEIGYYFQPKKIRDSYLEESEIKFIFYEKADVEILASESINFDSADQYLTNLEFPYNHELEITKEEYTKQIAKIKDYIKKGDTYQINFTTKAKFQFKDDAAALFLSGIFNQSARYSALINFKDEYIFSFSPELFFSTDYKTIHSKPMKGTVKRVGNPEIDKSLVNSLLDEKNRAENVMIVDLIRNDIGRIAQTDSVSVEKLYEIEKYETLYQLTSKVTGNLVTPEIGTILKSLFPSGSITGAPKIRSMQIIAELEKSPRKLYTGAIGILTSDQAVFNIPIRTLNINKKSMGGTVGLGSGIVWDSDPENEYDEVLLKGRFLGSYPRYFELLETILYEDGEYFLLDYHIKRLKNAAEYFLFKFDENKLLNELKILRPEFENNIAYKTRVVLTKWGNFKIVSEKIDDPVREARVTLSQTERCGNNKFLFHKTTYRPWDKILKSVSKNGFDEVFFYNSDRELLEGAISNIIIKKDGMKFTPPVELGILNGCYRQYLIDNEICREKRITLSELKDAESIFLINSVKKTLHISQLVDESGKILFEKNPKFSNDL